MSLFQALMEGVRKNTRQKDKERRMIGRGQTKRQRWSGWESKVLLWPYCKSSACRCTIWASAAPFILLGATAGVSWKQIQECGDGRVKVGIGWIWCSTHVILSPALNLTHVYKSVCWDLLPDLEMQHFRICFTKTFCQFATGMWGGERLHACPRPSIHPCVGITGSCSEQLPSTGYTQTPDKPSFHL